MSVYSKSPAHGFEQTVKSLRKYGDMLFSKDAMLPDGVIERLRSAKNLLVTIDNPWNSDIEQGINALIGTTLARGKIRDDEARRTAHPALWAMYEQRYDPPVDLRELDRLPADTLGGTYARFMSDNGIQQLQSMVRMRRPQTFLEWSIRRAYKMHDVMHGILGCDAEIMGEVRINAWSAGQGLGHPGSIGARKAGGSSHGFMGVGVLLMHVAYKRGQDFPEALNLAVEWLERGRRDPIHLPLRVEELWETPLEEVRSFYHSGRFLNAD